MAHKITRQLVLTMLIREHGFRRGAELGVWEGATLAYVLRMNSHLHMIGVDHWRAVGTYAGKDMQAAKAKALRAIAPYRDRVGLLELDTVSAAAEVPDGTLDFVFVDASHDLESVQADLRAWRPKVRAGGMLIGHDADWEGVQGALNALVPGWRLHRANVWSWSVP
jgi:predicted O-methyltransferase YrrM